MEDYVYFVLWFLLHHGGEHVTAGRLGMEEGWLITFYLERRSREDKEVKVGGRELENENPEQEVT